MQLIVPLLFLTFLFSENMVCPIETPILDRTIYSIGDTLSIDDQNTLFPICNGSGDYATGDSFSFSDLNGAQNGGDYKITLISMNATW
tara:strand:+ start:6339 stop:6602 length:264 start_codon:yes stop_codon:yes gene_type:complete